MAQTLVLDTTTKTLKVKMSGAAATTNPGFVATWADNDGTTFTEGATDGALNGASDVTLVAAPASSTRRVIKALSIENCDTAPVTLTIMYDNNGTQRVLAKPVLAVGDTWTTDGTYDNTGGLKTVQATGGALLAANNLSDVASAATARTNLGVGTGNSPAFTGLSLSGLTASEIVITDGSKNLASAAVATYPSLTELSYVKGVTSALQTQLNSKGVGDMTLAGVQSVTGLKTFDTTKLAVKGSSTGKTDIASANASASDYTLTLPAATGTVMLTSAIGSTVQAYDADLTTWAGVTPGTGIATALAVNVGTAGAPVINGGALGTPSSGTLTNATGLPVNGIVDDTTSALGIGTLELGHASDTTFARVSAGVASIEGKNIALNGTGETLTTGTIELGAASDTTISRVSAGVIAVEGVNVLTTAGGTMTGNIVLGENTSIDLDPAGSADGKYSGICITGTAGAALAFGDLVYLAAADSRWELTDADASGTGGPVLIGMCVLAAAGDASATKILLQGQIRADAKFPALTIGAPVYLGETAGAIQTAIPTGADNVIRVVGFALTADEIYFNPSQDHQLSVA